MKWKREGEDYISVIKQSTKRFYFIPFFLNIKLSENITCNFLAKHEFLKKRTHPFQF